MKIKNKLLNKKSWFTLAWQEHIALNIYVYIPLRALYIRRETPRPIVDRGIVIKFLHENSW